MTTLLGQCDLPVRQRMVGHWLRVDEGLGTRIAAAIRVDLDDARKAVEDYRAATEGSTLRSGLFEAATTGAGSG